MCLLTLNMRRGSVVPETGGDGGKQLGEAAEKRTETGTVAANAGLPARAGCPGRKREEGCASTRSSP